MILGCEQPKEEVLDISDILPTSSNDYDDVQAEETVDIDESILLTFNSNGFDFNSAMLINKRLFPERFGPDTTTIVELVDNNDTIVYHKWLYEDSAKVINSFYNWIDCFGSECESFYIGEERNYQKKAMQIFVSDTSLIFIEGEKLDFKKWYAFHDSLGYGNDWNYTIEQPWRGKARWYEFKNGKKIKY